MACGRTAAKRYHDQLYGGWATAADVPRPIKQWMLLAVGEMYANREALPDGFADRLLDPYRIWR